MGVPKKTRIALIVTACAVVAVAAVLLGVLLTQLGGPGPNEEVINYLPRSEKGKFLVAESNELKQANGKPLLLARSYDGNAWENVPNLDFKLPTIECLDAARCLMSDGAGSYTIKELEVPQQLRDISDSPTHLASRLYMQATFGANKEELLRVSSFYGTSYEAWVLDQMRARPTLTRAYYRARTNARPGRAGANDPVYEPCDLGSRWHRYVFERRDKGVNVVVSLNSGANRFVLNINGTTRGEVDTFLGDAYPGTNTGYGFPLTLRICHVVETVGGRVVLHTNLADCEGANVEWTNPAIEHVPGSALQVMPENDLELVPVIGAPSGSFIMKWRTVACSNNVKDAVGNSFLRIGSNTYRFDKRLRWATNTVENPIETALAQSNQCPIVNRNYQNREYCVRRASCGAVSYKSALFALNEEILRAWYLESRRYVYYVTNLRLEEPYNISPCSSGTSRWLRIGPTCPSPTNLDTTTYNTITAALSSSSDSNPYVRDISLTGSNCEATEATIGAQVQAGNECFQHVHPDLYSVRDFTLWVDVHDGNQQAMAGGNPNPIAKHAENGKVELPFPNTHPMTRFFDRRARIPLVGRYGDQINFLDLSPGLKTGQIAELVGAINNVNDSSSIVCGSMGEDEMVPELGAHYQVASGLEWWESMDTTDTPSNLYGDYKYVLQNVALKAQDQLRQRVAWSLSNFIVISDRDFDFGYFPDGWTGFYDIFVRHAFGNYRDILRDVSYNPIMGFYLSFVGNKAFVIENNYPDENYAREIMQLFSIGLWRLNDNGTQIIGDNGLPEETYTNDDIMDYARIWTGFETVTGRNNLANNNYYANFVDPMNIRAGWHDRLPKAKLDNGYIGDTYPLCDDLPAKAFLRQGARYEFTGATSIEGTELDSGQMGKRLRFAPTPGSSALHQALCAPSEENGGACTFPLIVTLQSNLPCSGAQECNAQRVLAVQIYDPVAQVTRYYSYIDPPCVRLTLFDNGKLTKQSHNKAQCADPTKRVASPACCYIDRPSVPARDTDGSECAFANEVTDYATMEQRCARLNLTVCTTEFADWAGWDLTCSGASYIWTNGSCSDQLQVYRSGRVGLIDPIAPHLKLLQPNSNNFFRVRWADNVFPQATDDICPEDCSPQPTPLGMSCICNFTISSTTAFSQASDFRAVSGDDAIEVIAERAPVGAPNPATFDDGTYSKCNDCTSLSGVSVWLHKDDNGGFSQRTIFELPPYRKGGRVRYLLNRVSTVTIGDRFSFRNPPHFAPLLGELTDVTWVGYLSDTIWSRKAEYEVEAYLEHLSEHQNTAVFVAYRLIQHMVTSNPSPRYVKEVVQAFRTGVYGNYRFSDRYGDLGAAVFAIIMDHEARSPIVEADITYGMLRDPLIKLYHVLRALDYTSPANREVYLSGLEERGGVTPFSSPSVFGFYLPEYRPLGPIGDAGLVAPQVQIATTPNLMSFLNGMNSFIHWGLTACENGFGIFPSYPPRNCAHEMIRSTSDGALAWSPQEGATLDDILDELSLLLTAGRLHDKNRQLLITEFENIQANSTSIDPEALRQVLKLLVVTPEFETNTYNHITEEVRQPSKTLAPPQGRPFKAIVLLFEAGGSDSFNILVPHSNCADKDMYEEYKTVRAGAAVAKENLLTIQVPSSTQPCDTFGVHPAMPNLHALYNEGDALFTSNVGVLVEPVTQEQYLQGTARLPPSIGAHNIMTRSAQNMHAQSVGSNGVLGRLASALTDVEPAFPVGLFSMVGNQKAVQGDIPADFISGRDGIVRLQELQRLKDGLGNLTAFKTNSLFAESQASLLFSSLNSTETLGDLLRDTQTTVTFGGSWLENQLQQVARLIKALPTAGYERALFFTAAGGFDTHFTFDLDPIFKQVDDGLAKFVQEMKEQGRWDDVVVMSFSEFGRTMTTNGAGTDHGWGSNNFLAGGKVKGGQILGKYPYVLSDDSELSLGRGRLIPTTPFEALWNGLGEWIGVTPELMNDVLPNLANFPATQLFKKEDLFEP